jgi:hypothetical protein
MEIGIIYSNQDPQHLQIHDFLVNYVKEHGVLARIVERIEEVEEPKITIDGLSVQKFIKETQKRVRLTSEEIARSIDERMWDV